MKFYLTKAAQRAAESGQAPVKKEKVAKAPRVVAEKAPRMKAEKAPSTRQLRASAKKTGSLPDVAAAPSVAAAPIAPIGSAFPAPAASAPFVATPPAPASPLTAPLAAAPAAAPVAAPVASVAAPVASAAPSVAPAAPAVAPVASVAATPAPKAKKGVITIGGQPRVDLLPLEVRAERKAGQTVRRAWMGVAAVVVLVGIAVGGMTVYAQNATAALTAAQANTTQYTEQAGKYSSVKTTQNALDLVKAARIVGGSTDVDWPSYLAKVALTVPSGSNLSALTVDSASPVVAYAQASAPLEGQRIATLTLTAQSTSLPSVPTWLDNISKLQGYEDATAGTVTLSDGVYTATVTLHINEKAFSNAYKKGN